MTKKHRRAALAKADQINRTQVAEMQAGPRTAASTPLNFNSVATLDPTRVAAAFAAAENGDISKQATLFELVEEQDIHVHSELSKRRRAVTGLGWQLTPPDDATQSELDRTEQLQQMLEETPRFEDAQYDLTDAIGKGFSALELDWRTGSEWTLNGLQWVPQRLFKLDKQGQLLLMKSGTMDAEPLRDWGWVVHEHRAKSGYIEQAALFRVLIWAYAYKAYNNRDLQRFLEMYGLPLRLGKYPAGTAKEQRDMLLRAVRSIGNDGAGVVPATMSIDFIKAETRGATIDFLDSIKYWEQKQSLAILGGTLTSQPDGKTSTNALGTIHDKVRREIMLHDARQIAPSIQRQVVQPLALINGMFPENRLPKFAYLTEETVDQGKMVDVLTKAVSIGMEIDLEWAHQTMQIPRAAADKPRLQRQAGPTPVADTPPAPGVVPPEDAPAHPAGASALSRLVALAQQAHAQNDAPTAMAPQLAALCAPHEQALLKRISTIVAESDSFEAAIAAMETLTAEPKQWAEDMALGMTASHLAGRADIGTN